MADFLTTQNELIQIGMLYYMDGNTASATNTLYSVQKLLNTPLPHAPYQQ